MDVFLVLEDLEVLVVVVQSLDLVLELGCQLLDLGVELVHLHVGDGFLALVFVVLLGGEDVVVVVLLVEDAVLHPGFFFVVDDLFQAEVCDGFFVLLDLLLVLEVEESVLADDDLAIHINNIVFE